MKTSKNSFIAYIFLILGAVAVMIPFFYMIQKSLEEGGLNNYIDVFRKTKFFINFANSFIVSLLTLVFLLFITTLAAYAFSKLNFRFKNILYLLLISGLMIAPAIVVFPVYKIVLAMGLKNNYLGLIGPYAGLWLPFSLLFLKNFMDDIPDALMEAATIDGCTPRKILFRIVLPLSKPAIIAISVIMFLNVWNEFFYAFIMLQKESMKTLAVLPPQFMSQLYGKLPLVFAMLVVIEIPVIVVYLFMNKYIMAGLVAGAIKE